MSELRHILVQADDGVLLPALWYAAGGTQVVVYVHGAGSSSIIRSPHMTDTFGRLCNQHGLDFIAFNNRGAGYMTKFDTVQGQSYMGGMAYEVIRDFVYDLSGVIKWAAQSGYESAVLVGHSTGANKIVYGLSSRRAYALPVAGAVLLSGGDDVALQRSRYTADTLEQIIQISKEKQRSSPRRLVPPEYFPGDHPISWRSLYELLNENGDYDMFPFKRASCAKGHAIMPFRQLKSIQQPVLLAYGSEDFGTIIPVRQALGLVTGYVPSLDIYELMGADHNFTGFEKNIVQYIVAWIMKRCGDYPSAVAS